MTKKGSIPWNKGLTAQTNEKVHQYTLKKTSRPNEKSRLYHEASRKSRLGTYYSLLETPQEWKILCGEFKIYDKEHKRTYFADAYSKELNIWVEFDEGHHFERGLLKEDCRVRENRIKKLLNCCFLRASFINNK